MNKFLINLIPFRKLRHKLRQKENQTELLIKKTTKCLMICPHPDDEIIGAGGFMLQHPDNFDVCCMSSSGLAYKDITAEQRANIRIAEFNSVMDKLGVKNKYIFKTYGIPPFIRQMDKMFRDYCEVLPTKEYDYILLHMLLIIILSISI